MENVWAQDQLSRYSDAARHMRVAATNERDPQIAGHYIEIAERFEQLAEQTRVLADA